MEASIRDICRRRGGAVRVFVLVGHVEVCVDRGADRRMSATIMAQRMEAPEDQGKILEAAFQAVRELDTEA